MNLITIWHNPMCSKSREAMNILEESNCTKNVINYLEQTPDKQQIKEALNMLGLSPRELIRTTEDIYKELNLKDEADEDKLIKAMINHPKLIQRPVIFKDEKAIIGRPTSIIADFISS